MIPAALTAPDCDGQTGRATLRELWDCASLFLFRRFAVLLLKSRLQRVRFHAGRLRPPVIPMSDAKTSANPKLRSPFAGTFCQIPLYRCLRTNSPLPDLPINFPPSIIVSPRERTLFGTPFTWIPSNIE